MSKKFIKTNRTFTFLRKYAWLLTLLIAIVGQWFPMATMQKASHQLGNKLNVAPKFEKKVTISDPDKCISCSLCTKVCPFQLEPYKEWDGNNQFSNKNCIKCLVCVKKCPVKLLSMEDNRTF